MSEVEITLGANCGVTFAGIKAASLISIKREQDKKLNDYENHFLGRGVYFERLKTEKDRVLLYVYDKKLLQGVLFCERNKAFLESEGYNYSTCAQALEQLKERINTRADFPHEIGIFLDYPLEDVQGFIADPSEGVQLCGYWKVYSDAEKKALKFKRFTDCSQCILSKLQGGKPLTEIFKVN